MVGLVEGVLGRWIVVVVGSGYLMGGRWWCLVGFWLFLLLFLLVVFVVLVLRCCEPEPVPGDFEICGGREEWHWLVVLGSLLGG